MGDDERARERDRGGDPLDEARREAAGLTTEDQGTGGGQIEATHGWESSAPRRWEGEDPPVD